MLIAYLRGVSLRCFFTRVGAILTPAGVVLTPLGTVCVPAFCPGSARRIRIRLAFVL